MTDYSNNLEASLSTDEISHKISYQTAMVSVPVTVTPFAAAGTITTHGLTQAKFTPGITKLEGISSNSNSFTVTQNICIAIPIQFGANAQVGDPCVISKSAGNNMFKGCVKSNS